MKMNTDTQALLTDFPAPDSSKIPKGIDWIEEMAGALTDPIIVYPAGGWEHDLPQPLRDRLPMDRLLYIQLCLNGKADWAESPDIEALLYLFPASLAAPMPVEWNHIYIYLGTKVMGQAFPDDIKRENLDQYEEARLRDPKRWIRRKKVEARRERHKSRCIRTAAIVPEKYEQAKLF